MRSPALSNVHDAEWLFTAQRNARNRINGDTSQIAIRQTIEQSTTMQCTNCLDAAYCSVECQRKHWARHKRNCQDTVERTFALVEGIKKLHKLKESNVGFMATYYWGNIPAVDLLNLPMNEGEECPDALSLLLCGTGDPRNVLLTIASLPETYKQPVTFVLNDMCPCTLARTGLLLYMLYKGILNTSVYLFVYTKTSL